MKISAAQAYCILDTVGSSILTKSGEISVSYLLELPEAYSLDRSDLEERHNELFRAFQYVRTGFIHKQDVFLRRKFKPEYVIEGEGYIQTAERKYFDGREYLHHFCILSFTLSGLQSLEKAYQANPLAYSEKLAKADRDRLAVTLALTGKGDNREEDGSVNTSLRAQQQSDFTLDDMMNTDGRPEYENFTDEVYRERSGAMYREDPEVIALQEQLRQNQRADSLKAAAAMKRRTAKARPKKETPKKEEPERTVGRFFSGEEPENKGNTIEAIVSGDQKITNGSVIKLVTLQEMQLPGGMVINKGTAVFGVVKLAQDRINITVESVRIGNSIYEMQKTVYDRDGLPGIYVPLNIKAEATKEAADEVVSDMNVTSYGTDVLSTGVNAVSNAAKSVFRKKNNQVVVTVKSNYKLYLK